MKHFFVGIAMLLLGAVAVPADKKVPQREPSNWVPMPEIKSSGFKAYYDSTSLTTVDEDTKGGIFLLSFPAPREMEVNGKKVMVGSIAKSLVIDCKKGIGAPIMDLYFTRTIPTMSDDAVAGTQYLASYANMIQFERKSVFYAIICAIQI